MYLLFVELYVWISERGVISCIRITPECRAMHLPTCLCLQHQLPHAHLHSSWRPAAVPSSGILTCYCHACGKPPTKNDMLRTP